MKSGKNYAFAGTPAKEVGLALNGEINNLTFFGGRGRVMKDVRSLPKYSPLLPE